jgi:AcrR family transcriptional regulator
MPRSTARAPAQGEPDQSTPAEREPAPVKRRRLPAEERRSEILEAARRVFVRDGLEGARTRDIAKEAKVNIATMFHYFSSKEELFEAAILQPLESFVSHQWELKERLTRSTMDEVRETGIAATREELQLVMDEFPLLATALFSSRELGSRFYREKLYPRLLSLGQAARETFPNLEANGVDPLFLSLSMFAISFLLAMDSQYREADLDVQRYGKMLHTVLVSNWYEGSDFFGKRQRLGDSR